MNIREALKQGTERLKKKNFARPEVESRLLLSLVKKSSPELVLAADDEDLTVEEEVLFEHFLNRRADYEPFAYLAGKKEFFGLEFAVNPAVLIPRPESEALVSFVLDWVKKQNLKEGFVVDFGSGSGCLSLSLSKFLPSGFQILGLEKSSQALEVSEQNARALGASQNIRFERCDFLVEKIAVYRHLNEMKSLPLILISNPPYIPTEEIEDLSVDVRDFEPRGALDGGWDGMELIEALLPLVEEAEARPFLFALETAGPSQIEKIRGRLNLSDGIVEASPHLFVERL